jgi:hypothetical protein
MTATAFRIGTEIVSNDPASTTGPGQVLPVYIHDDAPAPTKLRVAMASQNILDVRRPKVKGRTAVPVTLTANNYKLTKLELITRCRRADEGPSDPSSDDLLFLLVRHLVLSDCDVALLRLAHRAHRSAPIYLRRKHGNRTDLDAAHIRSDLSRYTDVDGIRDSDVSDHDVYETVLLLTNSRRGGSEQHPCGTQGHEELLCAHNE